MYFSVKVGGHCTLRLKVEETASSFPPHPVPTSMLEGEGPRKIHLVMMCSIKRTGMQGLPAINAFILI